MDTRAYLYAKIREEERRQEEHQKKMGRIWTPVMMICFWAVLVGAWMLAK